MLAPKRVKWRKVQKGKMRGSADRGGTLFFGEFGLQAIECGRVNARQLEAAR
ncbi:50S ribosomal protein L16, partial [bacterium]|nr:50S ribosomal protein L16 [bacterium]